MAENDDPMACEKHNVTEREVENLPSGYDMCPFCREQQRADAREREMHARRSDPNMHPTIDAPRR